MPAKQVQVRETVVPTELAEHLPNVHIVREVLPGVLMNGKPVVVEHTKCRDVRTCIGMNCGYAHLCHTERNVGYGVIESHTLV